MFPYSKLRHGKLALVGGGTGLVPLMRLITFVKNTDEITLFIGAKEKNEVFFEALANELLKDNPHKVVVTTEDGSYGEKGFVTETFEKFSKNTKFDSLVSVKVTKFLIFA